MLRGLYAVTPDLADTTNLLRLVEDGRGQFLAGVRRRLRLSFGFFRRQVIRFIAGVVAHERSGR